MKNLPNVFIASSTEGINVAEAVNIKMEHHSRIKMWDNAFDLSTYTLPSLLKRAEETDFGIFVFHKDDEAIIRGDKYHIVRDNVLFELGIFIGALGIDRCFILIPKSIEGEFRLPSDLAGLTITIYDDNIDDTVDSVATSCAKIKHAINKKSKAKKENLSTEDALEKQINRLQSELFSSKYELEKQKELEENIKTFFFANAKPATDAEVLAWEKGAKETYSNEIKIDRYDRLYYVDKEVIIPPLYGANSISVIVKEGVRIYSTNRSHNKIYHLDGFRYEGR